ncbi:hypothetical protein FGO68_gene720 [Halteria grandinella]|uniref:Uncharacterized protein n=1 Tax=Halteria grandinella TaxID=5974 RepID=A0A8J8NCH7_HALGN|nr:hypothetical protein FGO68_gene720 [Halteria grandinella]
MMTFRMCPIQKVLSSLGKGCLALQNSLAMTTTEYKVYMVAQMTRGATISSMKVPYSIAHVSITPFPMSWQIGPARIAQPIPAECGIKWYSHPDELFLVLNWKMVYRMQCESEMQYVRAATKVQEVSKPSAWQRVLFQSISFCWEGSNVNWMMK